jgi:hypothetical protein
MLGDRPRARRPDAADAPACTGRRDRVRRRCSAMAAAPRRTDSGEGTQQPRSPPDAGGVPEILSQKSRARQHASAPGARAGREARRRAAHTAPGTAPRASEKSCASPCGQRSTPAWSPCEARGAFPRQRAARAGRGAPPPCRLAPPRDAAVRGRGDRRRARRGDARRTAALRERRSAPGAGAARRRPPRSAPPPRSSPRSRRCSGARP